MDVLEAIRTRRTVKSYRPEPVPSDAIERILEVARWAPNHRQTEPWRFRVLGPDARSRLKVAAGAGAEKLDRAPTLVVASFVPSPLALHAHEDEQAAACAVYAVLLAARAQGLASYWRTPGVLRTDEGMAAVGLGGNEQVLGLLHFGEPDGELPEPPTRRPTEHYVSWLD
jgi:nitroreductase